MNRVWNYCCEVQRHAQAWRKRWPSLYELHRLTSGTSTDLDIQSDTINEVCRVFVNGRDAKGRCPAWRSRRSLGWVPLKAGCFQLRGDVLTYRKRRYRLWLSRPVRGAVKIGAISCDARGRWHLNLTCEVEKTEATGCGAVGIDLGLKTLATLSDGTTIARHRYTDLYAAKLATAQRAGNSRQVSAINAKITNCRRDFLHKESTRLANTYQKIVVGDVSPSQLKKTNMAKSVTDAGWYAFKEMLRYKMAIRHGAEYVEVSERLTTQTCSGCGCIAGPRGRAGLNKRMWTCRHCGVIHDRDVNAAINILGAECRPRVDEIAA